MLLRALEAAAWRASERGQTKKFFRFKRFIVRLLFILDLAPLDFVTFFFSRDFFINITISDKRHRDKNKALNRLESIETIKRFIIH